MGEWKLVEPFTSEFFASSVEAMTCVSFNQVTRPIVPGYINILLPYIHRFPSLKLHPVVQEYLQCIFACEYVSVIVYN